VPVGSGGVADGDDIRSACDKEPTPPTRQGEARGPPCKESGAPAANACLKLTYSMKHQPSIARGKIKLKHFDPKYSGGLDKDDIKEKTEQLRVRIGELQPKLYANGSHAVLMLFQGMDASGKDGSVRSVLQHVNPAGVEVANFKVPSVEESAHDYLWRVHKVVPRFGNIGVFNRSHYEAVLAERVLELVPKKVWRPRYRQIVEFERMLVENRVILLKFHLHISREEQAERFRERLENPEKNWKFSHADLKTRQLWDDYVGAYEDMLNATSHRQAPWHIVPADRNWYRDYVIASTVVKALEGLRMKWPEPVEDLSKVTFK
jgi:PPK2 family polyphosphate:nucleotide phosphotransferase